MGGHEAVVVVLRNTATTTCTLHGYPTAHFVSDGSALQAQSADVAPAPSTVTLEPGSPVATTVWTDNPEVPSPSYCQPLPATSVSVTRPPSGATVSAPVTITVCSAHNVIQITAVTAGTSETPM